MRLPNGLRQRIAATERLFFTNAAGGKSTARFVGRNCQPPALINSSSHLFET